MTKFSRMDGSSQREVEFASVRLNGSRLKRAKKSTPSFRRYNHDYDFDQFRDYGLPMHNTKECCKTYSKKCCTYVFCISREHSG